MQIEQEICKPKDLHLACILILKAKKSAGC